MLLSPLLNRQKRRKKIPSTMRPTKQLLTITAALLITLLLAGSTLAYTVYSTTSTGRYYPSYHYTRWSRSSQPVNLYIGPGPTNIDNSAKFYTYTSPPRSGGFSPGGVGQLWGLRKAVPYIYSPVNYPTWYQPYYAYPYATTWYGNYYPRRASLNAPFYNAFSSIGF
ncbi:hypothetical protein D6783_03000 [Candidatus Woesearchaeota archaeon]|nr:MAG: hypothetical protein D6783_03000 [Candidatus Woesearchaeota archaeon]